MVRLMGNTTMQLQRKGWNECNLTFAVVCHTAVRTGQGVCIHLQIETWILAFWLRVCHFLSKNWNQKLQQKHHYVKCLLLLVVSKQAVSVLLSFLPFSWVIFSPLLKPYVIFGWMAPNPASPLTQWKCQNTLNPVRIPVILTNPSVCRAIYLLP